MMKIKRKSTNPQKKSYLLSTYLIAFNVFFMLTITIHATETSTYSEQFAQAGSYKTNTRLAKALSPLIRSKDAVIIRDETKKILYQKNQSKTLVPASTLKVLTALAAIHHLGKSYRFPTDFYLDESNNLIVKGYGDPLLISEVIKEDITPEIKKKTTAVHHLIIDDSFFVKPIVIPGRSISLQPYDAPNGAFCVNFNTVFFKRVKGIYKSAEEQTPLLPYARQKAKASGLKSGRITLAQKNNEAIRYAAELFEFFIKDAGIKISGKTMAKRVSISPEKRFFRYESRFTLSETILKLMEYSNNFIANQLFIAIGAKVYGPPGSMKKGIKAVQKYAQEHIGDKGFKIVEGSGLSRQNKVTALFMADLLDGFAPHYQLMKKEKNVYFKTGTLKGVKTKIGYIVKGNRIFSFVILVNSPQRTTDPILKTILKHL